MSALNKDSQEMQYQPINQKFSIISQMINNEAFNGNGKVTMVSSKEFHLYEEGQNQIIIFLYSTGNLSITWRYKYYQKEVVHDKQFNNVRNLSIFEQQRIGEQMIREMKTIIEKHKKEVLGIPLKVTQGYEILAKNLNCKIAEIESKIKNQLREFSIDEKLALESIQKHKNAKYEQAIQYNCPADETPAGILEKYTLEYLEELKKNKPTQHQNFDIKNISMNNLREKNIKELSENYGCAPQDLHIAYKQILKNIPYIESHFKEELERMKKKSKEEALIHKCAPQDTKWGILLEIYLEYYNEIMSYSTNYQNVSVGKMTENLKNSYQTLAAYYKCDVSDVKKTIKRELKERNISEDDYLNERVENINNMEYESDEFDCPLEETPSSIIDEAYIEYYNEVLSKEKSK